MGIYGLTAFNSKPQQIEKIKKGFCKIFRENDLKITVEANVTKVNFLDVTLDLQSGKHYHYIKKRETFHFIFTRNLIIRNPSQKISLISDNLRSHIIDQAFFFSFLGRARFPEYSK